MTTVLDSHALIAFLRDEPGAEVVQSLLDRNPGSNYVHALNLCEVYYDF
jgi:PIN domain nuclease of toxin-antitoxin system